MGDERGVRSSAAGPLNVTVSSVTSGCGSGGDCSGTITAGSTLVVSSNIVVPPGQTLTIQPGAALVFNSGLHINGALNALGTSQNPIVMKAATPRVLWDGLSVGPAATVTLDYVSLLDVGPYGIVALDVSTPLIVDLSFVTIDVTCAGSADCAGIKVPGALSGVIADTTIKVSGTGSKLTGILGDLTNVSFEGSNTINVTAGSDAHGIGFFTNGHTGTIQNLTIAVTATSSPGSAVGIHTAGSPTIRNNVISASGEFAAGISSKSGSPTILSNVVSASSTASVAFDPYDPYDPYHTFELSAGHAIELFSGAAIVDGNQIKDSQLGILIGLNMDPKIRSNTFNFNEVGLLFTCDWTISSLTEVVNNGFYATPGSNDVGIVWPLSSVQVNNIFYDFGPGKEELTNACVPPAPTPTPSPTAPSRPPRRSRLPRLSRRPRRPRR